MWEPVFVDEAPDGRCYGGVLVAGEINRRHGLAAAAAPGLVLCVADGIVRIVVHVVAGEDLGGRLRRGIDRLIGVQPESANAAAARMRNRSGTFVWSMRKRSRPSGSPTLCDELVVAMVRAVKRCEWD